MYYPKSQIKTNLITNGKEFVYLSDNQPYLGSYWETSDGKYYTGKNPNDTPTFELILATLPLPEVTSSIQPTVRIVPQEGLVNSYLNLKGININNPPVLLVPVYALTIPTPADYTNGAFTRYFCKQNTQFIYLEITQATFRKLADSDNQIDYKSYTPFTITWTLTGLSKQEVANINLRVTATIERQLGLGGLTQYFKDYSQYYKFPNISNLYTSGGEFKTKDGQNYIGFYHIHDNTGPMVGQTHTKEPHGLLFPINEAIISEVTTRYSNQPMMSSTGSITPITTIPNTNMGGGGYSGGGGGY